MSTIVPSDTYQTLRKKIGSDEGFRIERLWIGFTDNNEE